MRTFDDLRADVLALFDRLSAIPVPAGYAVPAAAAQTAAARARLLDDRLTVVVCGEFKAGKSTLLGGLLDDPGLFPDGTLPTTNAVTTVAWGPVERIRVTLRRDDGSTDTEEISRAAIADYVTEAGNPANVRRVVLLDVETPNPRLRNGLMFVDTPGVGGVFDEHTAATLAFLPNADALVFVTDVEKPLVAAERVFLRQAIDAAKLTGEIDSLLAVLSKIDQTLSHDALLDDLSAALAALAGREVPAIPVSAAQKLKYLATGDAQALRISNFGRLEAELWAALGRRRIPVLLGQPLSAVDDEIAARLAPIDAAAAAAQDASGRTLADLQRQATERRDYLDRLTADGRTWLADLQSELDTAALRVQTLAKGELDANWRRFDTDYVQDDALLRQPEKLAARLGTDLSVLMGSVLRIVRTEVAAAVDRFAADKGITLGSPTISALPDLPPPQVPDQVSRLGAAKRGGGAIVARNTVAAVGIGSIIGTFVLPGLGTVIGGALAGYFGWRSSRDTQINQEREARRAELRRAFEPRRTEQAGHLRELIVLAFRDVRPDCATALLKLIEKEKETATNVLARLDGERARMVADAQTEQAGFDRERQPLRAVRDEVARLTAEVDALASGRAGPAPSGSGPAPSGDAGPAPTGGDDGSWADE